MQKKLDHLMLIYSLAYQLRKYPSLSIFQTQKLIKICHKKQIRLTREIKKSLCHNCSYIMVPFDTCSVFISKSQKNQGYRIYMKCFWCYNVNDYFIGNQEI